ncbi:bifunctional 3-(3-hydroxy-phenyl)propionate/3-hydroxycinnamic acid hydroxylase [Psychrobacter aquimaris]|uniref:bifunctional 3-(3-hydroxy-phenyl)propionate/3-hydroxycinnamic acid hydroxylase n=1 Tax=Psychrobacter aquimaris TaxID=292733 RepID=UPI003FD4CC8B
MGNSNTATINKYDYDVVILGAGPVGLTIANYLGLQGVKTLVAEQLDRLIDYPRAIGIDDESLRTLQSLDVIDEVLPHITPDHAMRFLTPSGRCFADIQPTTREFGWSRRNAFVQPQVDAVLLEGLSRFDCVTVEFNSCLKDFSQDDRGVTLNFDSPNTPPTTISCKYLIACDGGNSYIRQSLNIPFEGKTAPNKWIVIDVADDPLATPHVYLCCDPVRPYVSAALPHAIRRFEFMVMPNETEEELSQPHRIRELLSKVVPDPDNVNVIRQRVYTHNARLAGQFKIGRILLAGDAAHIMPVWQGQGYNTGIRDASNLAWKLSMVIKDQADDGLLETYQVERKAHAKAMIDLSVMAGNVLAPPKKWQGQLRDTCSFAVNVVPALKRYLVEMKFKPMPVYADGIVIHKRSIKQSLIGKMFIQPNVYLKNDDNAHKLDEILGNSFAILSWECDAANKMSDNTKQQWQSIGARFIKVVPKERLRAIEISETADELVIGDDLDIRTWLGQRDNISTVFIRPDRFVAATCNAQELNTVSEELFRKLHLTRD